nr:hypothetical protein [Sphingomonas glacialis]
MAMHVDVASDAQRLHERPIVSVRVAVRHLVMGFFCTAAAAALAARVRI